MIEIRTDEHSKPLTPDGPHDHEGTRAIADGIDEAFRLLNYATMRNGLAYPSDVYSMCGALSSALASFPQALQQITDWMKTEVAQGFAIENPSYGHHDGDSAAAYEDLADSLSAAAQVAHSLSRHLNQAQSAVAGMESAR